MVAHAAAALGACITVAARRDGTHVVIDVVDDGQGLSVDDPFAAGRIGLANLRQRLAYAFGDDAGLTLTVGGERRTLPCDHVVICAGQVSEKGLEAPLKAAGVRVHVIGGAKLAGELDAKRAIAEGTRVACAI